MDITTNHNDVGPSAQHQNCDGNDKPSILSLLGDPRRVLVVGDVVLDRYVYGSLRGMAPDAPIPVFNEATSIYCLGGCLNVANNLATFGMKVDVITVIGTDHDVIMRMLDEKGIHTEGLVVLPEFQTKTITKYVVDDRTLFRADKVSNVDISHAIEEQLQSKAEYLINKNKYDMIIASDYRNGATTFSLIGKIIAAAKKADIPVMVDPKRGDYHKYTGATIIKPNEEDARLLCGDVSMPNDALRVCKEFTERFAISNCILTMSSNGIALYEPNETADQQQFEIIQSIKKVNVIDTNGAGDTVTAALAFGYTHGLSLDECCRFAVTCANDVIQRHGTVTTSLINVIPEKVIGTEQELETLRKIIPTNRKVVLVVGCFDMLNVKNVRFLKEAKLLGDIVVVTSKGVMRRSAGQSETILLQEERLGILKEIEAVDFVIISDEKPITWIVDILLPDIISVDDGVNSLDTDKLPDASLELNAMYRAFFNAASAGKTTKLTKRTFVRTCISHGDAICSETQ